MDPRAALLQQESDENERFRNKSIGMHNLRAKLREQLKGYSHIRGFPLGPDTARDVKDSGRTESLGVRRDSIRRRASSVTRQQEKYDVEDSDSERKYRPRRLRKQQQSLLIPRILWVSVYLSLCFVAYKGLRYFSADTEVSLCQACSGVSNCGNLDEEFVVPVDNLAGLPFGTVFPQKSSMQCRLDVCVPGHVADPQTLCKVVNDEALLYRTRRLLQDENDGEHNARFLEYFRRRAMREEGMAGALSPGGVPPSEDAKPPKAGTSPQQAPPPQATPLISGNLANGAYSMRPGTKTVSMKDLPPGMISGGGDCVPLKYAPADGAGYANMTSEYYMVVTDVENYGQCCSICANEVDCESWTRVAGGDPSARQCYLKSNLELDPAKGSTTYNWQPTTLAVYPPNQELRYTGGVPIMFESGTKNRPFPDYVYGCPYPPTADGTCQVPAGCNCGGGTCYPGCAAPNVASSTSTALTPAASKAAASKTTV